MTTPSPNASSPITSPATSNNVMLGILMKIISVLLFVFMYNCLKAAKGAPAGELNFFRSFFGFWAAFLWVLWSGQVKGIFKTQHIGGHIGRGLIGACSMFFAFYALTLLPLPEVIAISYGEPLVLVALCAVILGEKVRVYRWSAVIVGLIGVMIIVWPRLTVFSSQGADISKGIGAMMALISAVFAAFAMLLVRKLVFTEKTTTIVLYFMITSSVFSLLTLPLGFIWPTQFGWIWPQGWAWCYLIGAGFFGGIAQIFMTEAYRYAEPSTVAPFEYASMLLAIITSYLFFGEIPTIATLIGAALVIAAGIFIIYRENRIRLEARKNK